MSTVKGEEFIKDPQSNGSINTANGARETDAYYIFDSKKATELKRLDEQHHGLVELAKGRLVHSPIENPKRILDIGCGTGITTVTLGRMFPQAEVIGLDMNPVPPIHDKPPNVTYIQTRIEDLVQSATEPNKGHANEALRKSSFDYIFARYLVLAISDWPNFISACTALLAPGGWLEEQEPEGFDMYSAASPTIPLRTLPGFTWDCTNVLRIESAKKGYDMLAASNLHAHFLRHGLNSVTSKHYPAVMYPWPARPEADRLGRYTNLYGPAALKAMVTAFASSSSAEQREEWDRQIEEMFDPEKGGEGLHFRFYAVCGRKEESG